MTSPAAAQPIRVAIAVVERDGAYLVGRRPQGVPLAGLWEFPGGKLHDGESPAEAAVRECREETGLDVAAERLHSSVVEQYPHGTLEVNFIVCRPVSASTAPRAPFAWVAAADLAELEFPSANAGLVRELAAAVR